MSFADRSWNCEFVVIKADVPEWAKVEIPPSRTKVREFKDGRRVPAFLVAAFRFSEVDAFNHTTIVEIAILPPLGYEFDEAADVRDAKFEEVRGGLELGVAGFLEATGIEPEKGDVIRVIGVPRRDGDTGKRCDFASPEFDFGRERRERRGVVNNYTAYLAKFGGRRGQIARLKWLDELEMWRFAVERWWREGGAGVRPFAWFALLFWSLAPVTWFTRRFWKSRSPIDIDYNVLCMWRESYADLQGTTAYKEISPAQKYLTSSRGTKEAREAAELYFGATVQSMFAITFAANKGYAELLSSAGLSAGAFTRAPGSSADAVPGFIDSAVDAPPPSLRPPRRSMLVAIPSGKAKK